MSMDVKEYKCPECGGALEWNSSLQKLKCPYCDSVFSMEEFEGPEASESSADDFEGDGAVTQVEMSSDAENFNWESSENVFNAQETAGMKVYSCQSCGAEIVADETLGATTCPYCGNNIVMTGQFAGDLRPDYIIPFKLDKEAAKAKLREHVRSQKYVPKVFQDENHIDEIKGMYVPFWLFDATCHVDQIYNCTRVRTWMTGEMQYTRTAHYKVRREGTMIFAHVPVDASKTMPDDLMESLEPYNFQDAVPFKTGYLAGYLADKYDVKAEDCIAKADSRIQKTATGAFRDSVTGYSSVNQAAQRLSFQEGKTSYALYPVWILNTSWNGEKYLFAMNGQTGKFIGNLPLDQKAWTKSWILMGAVIAIVLYAIMWFMA